MLVEVSKTTADRPKIVVYEQQQGSKFKSRVLYLQLVMVAGK
jgi:molecular chaperone GrpE (heat shock protein)